MSLRAAGSYLIHPDFPKTWFDAQRNVASYKAERASPGHPISRTPGKPPPAAPLDINRAAREELMKLPGIGPVLAERIVAYREQNGPFSDISEIKEVSGIGEKRFERIKPWILAGQGRR